LAAEGMRVKRQDLRRIVADVLEIDPDLLAPEAVLGEFENYDSVTVLSLMVELDEKAGVRLAPMDIAKLQSYGDIEELARKQGVELSD